ncbi:hypothetical protein Tsubulata_002311 [Turnera subulata]|uniref:factor independent urate hydroxylase n=1 Tax=Turnera subulata TaxID=218843 RepID=A0A9Q0J6L9_9ROSI|nr:hypothetical protein Tsubulata_002311 [Turnera subulata]
MVDLLGKPVTFVKSFILIPIFFEGLKLGFERHTTEAIVERSGVLQLTYGVKALSMLKTTQVSLTILCWLFGVVSSLSSQVLTGDKYTALSETRKRMLATEVTASWKYD